MVEVSVIIPACNEEKYIKKTIDSIKKQSFKDYEIIFVCNGCTDNTYLTAKKYSDKTIFLKEGNVSLARNRGVELSKGNILIFLDADVLLTKNVLKEIKDKLDERYVIGTCKAKPDVNKFKARLFMNIKNLFWWTVWSNGIIFCNKYIFDKAKGFDINKTKGEDGDFIKKAKKYGKYFITKNYVINSMRRYEKKGYFYVVYFWIKEKLFPSKEKYEVVR